MPRVDKLFSSAIRKSAADQFQFDLRYLHALEVERDWHDASVVPFWNERCFGLWKRSQRNLRALPASRKAYADKLDALIRPVEKAYDSKVRSVKDQLSKDVRATKNLIGSQAQRITVAARLKTFATALGPVALVREHVTTVRTRLSGGAMPVPPFATEADFLSRRGD